MLYIYNKGELKKDISMDYPLLGKKGKKYSSGKAYTKA